MLLLLIALAVAFGVLDAHLASGDQTFWLSQMSSLWLLLPFLAGWAGSLRRPASAVLGAVVTLVALVGYYFWLRHTMTGTAYAAHRYVDAGLVTGPLFGWLGAQWRLSRSVWGPALLCLAFVLEPYAWQAERGYLPTPSYLWRLEQLAGLLMAVGFAATVVWRRPSHRNWPH